jgi:hypothetical protein
MKFADLKAGMRLVVGSGFGCLRKGTIVQVYADEDGDLFVNCDHGAHYLDAQTRTDGVLEGFTLAADGQTESAAA